MSIVEIEEEIARELGSLLGDAERITFYLLVMGQRHPGLSTTDKNDKNLVKGCQSRIWFKVHAEHNRIQLSVDSNTTIIRGFGYLLVRLFNGQTPEDIINTELTLFRRPDLKRFLGTQRQDGVTNMIQHVRSLASRYVHLQDS